MRGGQGTLEGNGGIQDPGDQLNSYVLPLKAQHEVQLAWRQEADVDLRKEEQSTMLVEFRQPEADAVFSDGPKPGVEGVQCDR